MSPYRYPEDAAAELAKHRALRPLFERLDISTPDVCALAALLAADYVDTSTEGALDMLFGMINDDQPNDARTLAIDALTAQALYGPVGSEAQRKAASLTAYDVDWLPTMPNRYSGHVTLRGQVTGSRDDDAAKPNVAVLSGMRDHTNGERVKVCKPNLARNGGSPLCLASKPDMLAVYNYEPTSDPVTCTHCLAMDP